MGLFFEGGRPVNGDVSGFSAEIRALGTVPTEGSLSLDLEGFLIDVEQLTEVSGFYFLEPGTVTIHAGTFGVTLNQNLDLLGCGTEESFAIDTVEVLAVATPTRAATPTTRPSSTPVRPVLVQTDFAEDHASTLPSLGAGALTMIAAGLAGLAHRRRRSASRQH